MLLLCVKAVPVAVTVKCDEPVLAREPLVKVSVEDTLLRTDIPAGLKLPVTPAASPEIENATSELNPAPPAVVNFSVPFAVELTVTVVALGLSAKPGTFNVTV